jgi:glycosyltransferase involved in cell wall biosynthesis
VHRPLVSIIIPVHNSARWLAATLESALNQSWERVEILVVDDGSTDESANIIRRYARENLTLIAQQNSGAAAARNAGIAASRGDFLQFLDADDMLGGDKIERQIARLQTAGSGFVATCAWGRFYGDDASNASFIPEAVWQDLSPVDWLVRSQLGGGMMATAAWLVPRAVAERVGPWDTTPSPNDDGEYFARVMLASRGVLFVPEARVYYRSGIGGWSSVRSPAAVAGLERSLESICSNLLRVEDSSRTRNAMATAFDRLAFDLYPACPVESARAARRARELGGSRFVPPRGGVFGVVSRIIGWRLARRIQYLSYAARQRRLVRRARGRAAI